MAKFLNFCLCFFILALIFLLSKNSYFWYDDFWLKELISNNNFFSQILDGYLNWDGRTISPVYWFRNLLIIILVPDYSQISSLISSGVLFLISYIIGSKIYPHSKDSEKLVISIFIFIGLILSFRPHLSRVVYWLTGSYYLYSNAVLVFLCFYILKIERNVILTSILIFIVVSSGVNNGVLFLVFLGSCIFLDSELFRKKEIFAYMIILLFTLSLVTLAPGNFVRGSGKFDISIYSMVKGFYIILLEYTLMSKWVVLSSLIIALFFPIKESFLPSFSSTKLVALFSISGVASIIPFVIIPEAASKHTAIFFQTFIFIGLLFGFSIILNKLKIRFNLTLISVFKSFFLLYSIYLLFNQFQIGKSVKVQIVERYKILDSKMNIKDTVFLNPINITEENFTNRSPEIAKDSNDPINKSLSDFYKTGPIVLKD